MFSPIASPPRSPRRTLQQIEQEAEENLRKADATKAIAYVESHSIRKLIEVEQRVKYPLCSDISEFGNYGIGLLLYLNFLKKMSLIFAIMSIMAIPSLISNLIGDGLDPSASKLIATTLANQPLLKVVIPDGINLTTVQKGSDDYSRLIQANDDAVNSYNDLVNRNILMVAVPDLIYSIVFILFVIHLRMSSRIIIESLSRKNVVLLTDFAVEVKGFPRNITNPEVLETHFGNFGEVIEANLARDYHNTLMYNKKQAILENKIRIEKKRIEYDNSRSNNKFKAMNQQRSMLSRKIEKKLEKKQLSGKKHDEYPSLKAYVLFQDSEIAKKLIKQYKNFWRYSLQRILCPCCWDIRKVMPQKYKLLNEYPLVLKKPPAPSDILWENLDIRKGESFLRKLTSAILVFFLMLFTFVIIFAAQMKGPQTTSDCPSVITSLSSTECICSQYSTSQIFINADLRDECWDYALKLAGFQAISVAGSFIIVLVNFFLKWLLISLGKFERYHTLTDETLSSMMKVFAAMFFNTAGITLIISARFGGTATDSGGIVIAREIGKIIPYIGDIIESNKDQYPNDLNRLWYTNVGNKIIYTWIINIVSPHIVYFLMTPIISWRRRRNAKKSFIQRDMNLFSVGPRFEMIPKYALALNTVFVTLFYCSGMPILLFFGSASLFLQYWVEKYLLLRFYETPPSYNHDINTVTLRLIPLALIFHLAIGIYTYGSEDIFMKEIKMPDFGNGSANIQFISSMVDFNALIKERIYKVIYCFIALAVIAAIYFLDMSLFRIISNIFKKIVRKKQISTTAQTKTTFKDNEAELKQQGMITYEIRGNNNYRDLVASIDIKDAREFNQGTGMFKNNNLENKDELIKLKMVDLTNGSPSTNS